jgi:hypothetical protein
MKTLTDLLSFDCKSFVIDDLRRFKKLFVVFSNQANTHQRNKLKKY